MKQPFPISLCIYVLAVILGSTQAHAKKLNVLFIGNSYIYTNDLPQLISQLATSTSDQLTYNSNTPGGTTFKQHTTNATTLSLIAQGNWDFVVLQEQSQFPSFPDAQVAQDVFPYAHKLDSLVKKYNPCAKTVFYMTWGRKNGDASNCATWPPVCTYTGMDSMLQLRYTMMADSNNAVLSPVARVWRSLRNNYPAIELYDADESHPSLSGSYAAACTFYTIFFKKDPTLCSFNSSLNSTDAGRIKTTAKQIVFDSLNKWYQYTPAVSIHADFNYTVAKGQVTFTNSSTNADSYTWYFGDGDSSTQQHPVHQYTGNGTYHVMLVGRKCADTDTITKEVQISEAGIAETNTPAQLLHVYPNPVHSKLFIESQSLIEHIFVSNVSGRTVIENTSNSTHHATIDITSLPPGSYYIKVVAKAGTEQSSFVKQ